VKCDEFRSAFSRLLDKELPAELVPGVEAHAATCQECAAYARELSALDLALRNLPEADVPIALRMKLKPIEEKTPQPPFWIVPAKVAAYAAVALAVFLLAEEFLGSAEVLIRAGVLASGYLVLMLKALDREWMRPES
jgi:anti-sigma factor RsiW